MRETLVDFFTIIYVLGKVGKASLRSIKINNVLQISTFSKTIDTPYSSVSKSDVRVSNPGLAYAAPAALPAYHGGFASPYVSHVGLAAPVAKVCAHNL